MRNNMMMKLSKWLFIGVIGFTVPIAMAVDLNSLNYSSLSGDKVQLILTFSESVDKPNTFSIDDPARVVLDFAGVKSKLAKKTQQINLAGAKSISVVGAGDRTRVVINLDQTMPYTIEKETNNIIITLEGGARDIAVADSNDYQVDDIDFHRGNEGEAQLKIHLNNENVSADVYQERGTIIVDLKGVELPSNLHRRLDVVDFGTPVQFIDSIQTGNNTRLTLSTTGEFEHLAYQSDKTLVVEVKPISEELTAEERKKEFGYQGEQLSLNFQNIEVRAVLQLLADFTGLNLVTSDTVQGNLTLRLKNVPWDQALDIILKTKGLAKRESGNIMLIAPIAEIAAREKQELAAKAQLIELEPLYSEVIEVNFAKASELAKILSSGEAKQVTQKSPGVTGFISKRGNITIDERTNSLLIRDTAEQLIQIHRLIDILDIPIRQVLIESRIVIANNDFSKELGVRFGVSARKESSSSNVSDAFTSGSLNGTTATVNGEDLELQDRLNVNLPVTSAAAGRVALALAKLPFGGILELELSAMQQEGKGEIVSSPRVITSNQKTAIIEQGTEIPYLEASSSGAATVAFKEAVLKLEVTPQITPDDKIVMDLKVHKDEVGRIFLGIPSIDTRRVETQVLVENGETVVLGGIYEQKTSNSSTRVPFFGDLPVVGRLFKGTKNEDSKRELLIFITPKIIKDSLNSFH